MGDWETMGPVMGLGSAMNLVEIVVYLAAIGFAWWTLQEVRFDVLLKHPKSRAAKLLQLLLAIALGYGVGGFFMHYLQLALSIGFY